MHRTFAKPSQEARSNSTTLEIPMRSQATIQIVKSTAPVLTVHGGYATITRFYARLFQSHPEFRNRWPA